MLPANNRLMSLGAGFNLAHVILVFWVVIDRLSIAATAASQYRSFNSRPTCNKVSVTRKQQYKNQSML